MFSLPTAGFIQELQAIIGSDGVSTAKSVCSHHGRDESYHRYNSVVYLYNMLTD